MRKRGVGRRRRGRRRWRTRRGKKVCLSSPCSSSFLPRQSRVERERLIHVKVWEGDPTGLLNFKALFVSLNVPEGLLDV